MIKIIKWLSSCFKKKVTSVETPSVKEKKEITKVILLSLAYSVKEIDEKTMHGFLGLAKTYKTKKTVEKYENFVLPLENFDMIEEDKCNKLVLNGKGLTVPKRKYSRATLSLGNDARMTWASDWSDLGTFRLVYKLFKPKVYFQGNKLILESPRTKKEPGRDRDITIPDRTKWF